MKIAATLLAVSNFVLATGMAHSQTKPPTAPASAPTVPPVNSPPDPTFPPVTYACVDLSIPDDDKSAEGAIDEARVRWYETARRAGLKQASSVFIHAAVPPADAANKPNVLPAEACGIVSQGATIQGMKMHRLLARKGLAGFCDKILDVQECLASAAKAGGFTEAKPWPWLPMYARWPEDRPIPVAGTDVIQYLRTAVLAIPYAPPGSGVPRERSTNGPKPLVECKDCVEPDGPKEAGVTGKGIGWFIPLN